ncbi:MAG TPA: DHH family phosphoesterase [Trueperaceae bacterium]|nr:DHH family phosphoesterase [Trueperaceae bacterium]
MSPLPDNSPDPAYREKLGEAARVARSWDGPIVVLSHVDPDGDAVGSCLALSRALRALGKDVTVATAPPRYLRFLAREGELVDEVHALPEGTLLFVLDVADLPRVAGGPVEGAAFTVNIDHHGTNDRFGDIAVVQPGKAATALLVKELIEELGVSWTPQIATPCLTGIITDTGNFRFANTSREVLEAAGELLDHGVDYVWLTDRLQWRHPDYFRTLGRVMETVEFGLGGALVLARYTADMKPVSGAEEDDSDDFVGIIRYAEGVLVAALLKERGPDVKVSVRTRDGVSAQAICVELGGGGHVAAAGATIRGVDMDEARRRLVEAARRELERQGKLPVDA